MQNNKNINQKIKTLQIGLASPEKIYEWSHGAITKSETIHHRTHKPIPGGLFDEAIFGPEKDYTCHCGRYSGKNARKYIGKRCEVCGVEIIPSVTRRERMAHIELAVPVAHIWYMRDMPSSNKIALVLGTKRKIDDVIYFKSYVVINNNKNELFENGEIVDLNNETSERRYRLKFRKVFEANKEKIAKSQIKKMKYEEYYSKLQDASVTIEIHDIVNFIAEITGIKFGIGAEAILELLKKVDVKKEIKLIKGQIAEASKENSTNAATKEQLKELNSRMELLSWFDKSGNKPEWMILTVLPVIPPEARPLIQLETGNFTSSDLNELYRLIIARNEKVKKMIEEDLPASVINNDKRLLQEAVDALLDNSAKSKPIVNKNRVALSSITDKMKGKSGLFRQNLLGKRVDYSGRSAIVAGPNLKLYEAGIPMEIILKMFKPFIIAELIRKVDQFGNEIQPVAVSPKDAEKMIQRQDAVIWPYVNEVIKKRPIILNRAPTLHRLGIQAFEIKPTSSKAISLHPLVCTGFNADFDGDTMAVHLPLSVEAVAEARSTISSLNNLIMPNNGNPSITPTIDMLLGNYYLTLVRKGKKGEGLLFSTNDELNVAYNNGAVELHTIVGISAQGFYPKKQNLHEGILLTSVGRVIFNNALPEDFDYIDGEKMNNVSEDLYLNSPAELEKQVANLQFSDGCSKKYIYKLLNQVYVKYGNIETAKFADQIKENGFKYATKSGITYSIFDFEKYTAKEQYIEEAKKNINEYKQYYEDGLLTNDERYVRVLDEWRAVRAKVGNDIKNMLNDEKKQDSAIILMKKSGARGNDDQITQSLGMRGLMARSYNYSMNANKGVVKDTIEIPVIHSFVEGLTASEYFSSSYGARKSMVDTALKTSKSGYITRKLVDSCQDVIVVENDCGSHKGIVVHALTNADGQVIESLSDRIIGRYTAKAVESIVGKDELITAKIAEKIEKAGIKEVEIRSPITCQCKNGVCAKCYGIDLATNEEVKIGTTVGVIAGQSMGEPVTQLNLRSKATGGAATGVQLSQGYERVKQILDVVKIKENEKSLIAKKAGVVQEITNVFSEDRKEITNVNIVVDSEVYSVWPGLKVLVKVGDQVQQGQILNYGSIDLKSLLEISGLETVREYIIQEIQRVYRSQGLEINDKYIEVVVKQMTNKYEIVAPGESDYYIGQTISTKEYDDAMAAGSNLVAKPLINGLDDIPAFSDSFLSAASFQYTKHILINAAIRGDTDYFDSLKENVMLGNLIPAGTGVDTKSPEEVIRDGAAAYKKLY